MSSPQSLLDRHAELAREQANLTHRQAHIDRELAEIEEQILALGRATRTARRRRRTSAVRDGLSENTAAVVNVLRESGALGPHGIAEKLGITRGAATKRLETAIELKLVEKVGYGRYACSEAVKSVG